MTEQSLFEKLIGRWEGTCRTCFETEKLASRRRVRGDRRVRCG